MKAIMFTRTAVVSTIVAFAMFASGCSQQASESGNGSASVAEGTHDEHDGHDHGAEDHSHGGWWCVEHAVPEEDCSMCSTKVADKCKAKGDWCEEHNRAESQCFKCDPSRAEKFAKLYEAKFGHAPAKATE